MTDDIVDLLREAAAEIERLRALVRGGAAPTKTSAGPAECPTRGRTVVTDEKRSLYERAAAAADAERIAAPDRRPTLRAEFGSQVR